MKRSYEQMNSSITEEITSVQSGTVENRIIIDEMEDIETISGSVNSFQQINIKLPYFSYNKTINNITHSDKQIRIDSLADLKENISILNENKNNINNAISILKNQLHIELDEFVKQLIINCLSIFAQLYNIHTKHIIDELLLEFKYKSNTIRATLLKCFENIFNCKEPDLTLRNIIQDICIEQIHAHNVLVRKNALSLLYRISTVDNIQEILSTVCELDPDPRVRCIAFKGFLILHQRNISLDINLYKRAVEGMNDDNNDVKLTALELMWLLCNLHPNHIFTTKSSENTRLVDDGFIRICNMVTDNCVLVRAKASGLLGGLRNISTQYLLQAFSKELFGRGDKMKLSRTKGNDISAAGDFDLTLSADVNVLDSGAGAFVHGLEDEYYQVRMATIDSICELSSRSPEFARIAVEFLVDMFNDEINSVRINSIHSLRKIASHIQLNEEQLQIAMSALEDVTSRLRHAMQQLLMTVRLSNIQSVHISIQGLVNNLKKYPEDKETIFQALQGIGLRHSTFVEYLVENLLNIDLNFAQMEANVNDVFYIAKLIAILNAASKNSHILTLLPKHTPRHYRYLKDKYPSYFPSSLLFDNQITILNNVNNDNKKSEPITDLSEFFKSTWENIVKAYNTNSKFKSLLPMIDGFSKSLENISHIHDKLSSFVDFYTLQHRILTIMLQAQSHKLREETSKLLPELLLLTYQIENTLFGLHTNDIIELHIIRLFCNTLKLVGSLSNNNINSSNIISTTINTMKKRVLFTTKYCEERKINIPEHLQVLLQSISNYFSDDTKSNLSSRLLDLLKIFTIHPFTTTNQLKTLSGKITYPQPNSENPIKFNPVLPLRLEISGTLKNIMNSRGIMILCVYPDNHKILFPISEKNMTPLSTFETTFQCIISLDSRYIHGWNESNAISLQLVKIFDTDIPEIDNKIILQKDSKGNCYIQIGQPILYHIFPKKGYQPSIKKRK